MAAGTKATGKDGSVSVNGKTIYHVFEFDLEIADPILDETDFVAGAAGWEAKGASGVKNWKGSFKAYADSDNVAVLPGGAAAAGVFTATTGRTYSGNVILSSMKLGPVKVKEKILVEYAFEGTGACTPA